MFETHEASSPSRLTMDRCQSLLRSRASALLRCFRAPSPPCSVYSCIREYHVKYILPAASKALELDRKVWHWPGSQQDFIAQSHFEVPCSIFSLFYSGFCRSNDQNRSTDAQSSVFVAGAAQPILPTRSDKLVLTLAHYPSSWVCSILLLRRE
jgi:hypothetical protein